MWPRGVSKEAAQVDLWIKDVAPSAELRRWFNHEPEKWEEFQRRYRAELQENDAALEPIRERVSTGPVTFVYASREMQFNNAVALKAYLEE